MPNKRSVTLTLHADRDADIIAWLDNHTNGSAAIRDAIRARIGGESITSAHVLTAVLNLSDEIQELKRSGVVVAAPRVVGDEPADIATALDELGL